MNDDKNVMRAQFEAWARKRCMDVARSADDYDYSETADAWLGYQAALQSQAVVALVEAGNRSLNWLSSYRGGGALGCYDQMHTALAPFTRSATVDKGDGE